MIVFIFIVLYVLLGSILSFYLYQHLKQGWSLYCYSMIYLILFYVVAPIVTLMIDDMKDISYYTPQIKTFDVMLMSFFTIIIGFYSFHIGYKQIKNNNNIIVFNKKVSSLKASEVISVIICIISIICLFFYVKGFGSLSSAIDNANLIRSGVYKEQETQNTSHTFFFRFIFLSIIPILYYFSKKKRNKINLLLLIISGLILFVLYFFLSSGRQVILDFFLIFILVGLINSGKAFNLKILLFGLTAFLLLPVLDNLFSRDSSITMPSREFLPIFIDEFGFPYFSLTYSIQENYNNFFFLDFFSGLFGTILPSSWNPGFESSNYLNSIYMIGQKAAYIPPGLFAQGYYSLGIIGVFIIGFFTGKLFWFIDDFFMSIKKNNVISFTYFYAYFITISLAWVRTGLPYNYFYHTTALTLLLFLYFSFNYKKIPNETN